MAHPERRQAVGSGVVRRKDLEPRVTDVVDGDATRLSFEPADDLAEDEPSELAAVSIPPHEDALDGGDIRREIDLHDVRVNRPYPVDPRRPRVLLEPGPCPAVPAALEVVAIADDPAAPEAVEALGERRRRVPVGPA